MPFILVADIRNYTAKNWKKTEVCGKRFAQQLLMEYLLSQNAAVSYIYRSAWWLRMEQVMPWLVRFRERVESRRSWCASVTASWNRKQTVCSFPKDGLWKSMNSIIGILLTTERTFRW